MFGEHAQGDQKGESVGNLLPCFEDGFYVGVKVLSVESTELETVVHGVGLLQLHDLLR